MTKKLILLLATCLLTTSCLFGCGDDAKPSDATTTAKVESTTKKDVATTEPTTTEPTTEEPTTKEVETTTKAPEVEYLRKGFGVKSEIADYFDGLTLEKGDIIYINELYPVESDDYDSIRGSVAVALLRTFKMREEENLLNSKYREEGSDGAEIPHSANYYIEYSGEKIQFIFVENESGNSLFDIVFVK